MLLLFFFVTVFLFCVLTRYTEFYKKKNNILFLLVRFKLEFGFIPFGQDVILPRSFLLRLVHSLIWPGSILIFFYCLLCWFVTLFHYYQIAKWKTVPLSFFGQLTDVDGFTRMMTNCSYSRCALNLRHWNTTAKLW